ncbi:hypothetical protein AMAG_06702 [Allomyces macrogynus ATCC 38327]|uniref:Inorganic phosphate transporter Pho88 n=1 Tax=Allomyces macrogynus (strain ATCC 38327) TaxID=578462 RepID=A0A0L0SEX1_ALLM3|nr:hypothetical protein AMAG_06702 [Allomyces macrogynus ATCC 38327]|eukprot:KNE60940.1 hypothetical protein AMAG_06702 [Allomyces macrogynus ATCC 38327]
MSSNPATKVLINVVLMLGLVQLSQRLGIGEKEELVPLVRLAFTLTAAITTITMLLIKSRIKSRADGTPLRFTPLAPPGVRPVTATVYHYDLMQHEAMFKQHMMSMGLMGAVHAWGGFVQPLFLQVFLPWKLLWEHNLFQIYIRGKEATGELARPWPMPSMFGTGSPDPAAEKPEQPAKEKDADADASGEGAEAEEESKKEQ